MADYFTHFCIALGPLSARKLAYWRGYEGHRDDDGEDCCCFDIRVRDDGVVLEDAGGYVNMDHVARALRSYLAKFRIKKPVIVPFAHTCSSSRADAFDGGVVVVWATREAWLNAAEAGQQIADGLAPKVDVVDHSTPLDELDDSTRT